MSVSLDVLPLSRTVDMFGDPDPSSAYSLSGHISISLASEKYLFEPCRPTTLVLQSLTVTFEGQSEVITARTGYVPLRLCTLTRELVPAEEVIEITNEGHEDLDQPCVWNVVFNIPIPGWLPASSAFGVDDSAGTNYAVYANATFFNPGAKRATSWLSMLCLPFRSTTINVQTQAPITLNRYYMPPNPSASSSFSSQFGAASLFEAESEDSSSLSQPQVDVHFSVPERMDASSSSVPFTMRLRAIDADETFRKNFQVHGFSIQFLQSETYRDTPSSEYAMRFAIPPPSLQPPEQPLLNPNSLGTLHEVGFMFPPVNPGIPSCRTFSLLPSNVAGRFALADAHIFADDQDAHSAKYWHVMESNLPFVQGHDVDDSRWAGREKLRPSLSSPLFDVKHEMQVSIACSYTIPEGDRKLKSKVQFQVPIRLVEIAPSMPPPSSTSYAGDSPRPSIDSESETTPLFVDVAPGGRNLPAYSQLFDSSGERLIDYSTPLPLYSPPSTSKPLFLPQTAGIPSKDES